MSVREGYEWGPAKWREFHEWTLNSSARPEWLDGFIAGIPCDPCRVSFQALLGRYPYPASGTVAERFAWGVTLHNCVNRSWVPKSEWRHRLVGVPQAAKLYGAPFVPVPTPAIEAKPCTECGKSGRIIRNNEAGFCYNLNRVIYTLWQWPSEPLEVDWSLRFPTDFHYGGPGDGNVWDKLFEPLGRVSDPVKIENRHQDEVVRFVADNIAKYYRSPDPGWRMQLNAAWSRVKLQPETKRRINESVAALPAGPRVGIHVRHDKHAAEQPNRKLPTLAQMADAAKAAMEKIGAKRLVLATDTEETVSYFRQQFGDALHVSSAARAQKNVDKRIDVASAGSLEFAYDVLCDIHRLAACDCLVCVCSNVATCAAYVNPNTPLILVEAL